MKFMNSVEVCYRFKNVDEMHKEAHAVLSKAMKTEVKRLMPDLAKGAMSMDIQLWAMKEDESTNPGERARWTKYTSVLGPANQTIVTVPLVTIVLKDDDQEEMVDAGNGEAVNMEDAGNAGAVEMVVRAPERDCPILSLEVNDYKPEGCRCSKHLKARRV
ncbi:hypothetical protein D1007_24131 [Hordeum vulgare]|nr:hypothetical protein D1007_24131 [Hordeum vulgare]